MSSCAFLGCRSTTKLTFRTAQQYAGLLHRERKTRGRRRKFERYIFLKKNRIRKSKAWWYKKKKRRLVLIGVIILAMRFYFNTCHQIMPHCPFCVNVFHLLFRVDVNVGDMHPPQDTELECWSFLCKFLGDLMNVLMYTRKYNLMLEKNKKIQ